MPLQSILSEHKARDHLVVKYSTNVYIKARLSGASGLNEPWNAVLYIIDTTNDEKHRNYT